MCVIGLIPESGLLGTSIFGSFDGSEPSCRFDCENGVATGDPLLFEAFANCWDQPAAEAG